MFVGEYILALLLFVIGFIIMTAKIVASEQEYTIGVILAKGVLNGMTSLMAGALLLVFTSASPLVIIALGAFLGSVGTEASIAFIKKKLDI